MSVSAAEAVVEWLASLTVLAFLDALIDGGNMPSAATPCGLTTGRAFHLVTHLPPAPSLVLFLLQFLKVFCFTDMIGGKPIIVETAARIAVPVSRSHHVAPSHL